jgi:hypothetical protein
MDNLPLITGASIYKHLNLNNWVNTIPRHADFKIGHVLQIMFEKILYFLKSNKLQLNCSKDDFFNEFANFAYQNRDKYINYN